MGIGEENPPFCFVPKTQRMETSVYKAGAAGSYGVALMLTVSGEGFWNEKDFSEGCGRKSNKPIVHKEFPGDSMGSNQIDQWTIPDQCAACDIILDKETRKRDGF